MADHGDTMIMNIPRVVHSTLIVSIGNRPRDVIPIDIQNLARRMRITMTGRGEVITRKEAEKHIHRLPEMILPEIQGEEIIPSRPPRYDQAANNDDFEKHYRSIYGNTGRDKIPPGPPGY